MKISPDLGPEDKKILEGLGVVFEEGQPPHFEKKEAALPQGMKRLPSGKVIPFKPIGECLKW